MSLLHAHQPHEAPVWVYPKQNPEWKQTIIKEFKLHPVIADILVARGFKTIQEIHDFLYAKLPDLHDPFLFKEMSSAVKRVLSARKNREKILIYGDNDVDGMSGTALLTEFLRFIDCDVVYFIASPSSQKKIAVLEALETAKSEGCKVLITVDVGTTAHEEIEAFQQNGIDVIVTDHHEPSETLPSCTAILNPKAPGSSYPDRDLTGVGVAFKLAHGLTNQLSSDEENPLKKIDLKRYLDLVALGTISDMGAIHGENRILIRYGLLQMKKGKRMGLAKLIQLSEIEPKELNTYLVASRIGPQLNSLGRIANPNDGVKLLITRTQQTAEKLAKELGLNNIERQRIEKKMTEEADKMLSDHPELLRRKALILASPEWHPGIIPILATRLSKLLSRPTVIIAVDQGIGKGSLRSIPEFPLLDALRSCQDLIQSFGGHEYAAGLLIKEENIPAFIERFTKIANDKLKEQDVKAKLQIDAEVRFRDLTYDCLESLRLLEPFGNENPAPLFATEVTQAWPPKLIGKSHDKSHLKMYLEQDDRLVEGIAFYRGSDNWMLKKKGLHLKVAFSPQMDVFFEQSFLQLMIRDFLIVEEK